MKKVLIVCGNGLGSSFIVEMNVKKILAEMNKEAGQGDGWWPSGRLFSVR